MSHKMTMTSQLSISLVSIQIVQIKICCIPDGHIVEFSSGFQHSKKMRHTPSNELLYTEDLR